MSLSNKRVSVMANTVVDSTTVATYSAVINLDADDMTVTTRYPDSTVYESHKEIIEADRDNFVVLVNGLRNSIVD